MTCHYCGYDYNGGGHDLACPVGTPPDRMREWSRGYDDGRAGKRPREDGPVYMLGWRQGDSAADEATNG